MTRPKVVLPHGPVCVCDRCAPCPFVLTLAVGAHRCEECRRDGTGQYLTVKDPGIEAHEWAFCAACVYDVLAGPYEGRLAEVTDGRLTGTGRP